MKRKNATTQNVTSTVTGMYQNASRKTFGRVRRSATMNATKHTNQILHSDFTSFSFPVGSESAPVWTLDVKGIPSHFHAH